MSTIDKQRVAAVRKLEQLGYTFAAGDWMQSANDAAAVVEYQKSIEFGVAGDDVCPYQPYDSLVAFYTTEMHQYDKAWDFVHRARESGVRIQPELMDKLKKNSGRTD